MDLVGANRVAVHYPGRRREHVTIYLSFAAEIPHGSDDKVKETLLFSRIVTFCPVKGFKGKDPRVCCTATAEGKSIKVPMPLNIKDCGSRGGPHGAGYPRATPSPTPSATLSPKPRLGPGQGRDPG